MTKPKEKTMNKLLNCAVIIAAGASLSGCGMWPPYNAWDKKVQGEGDLAKAQSDRQIATLEAKAALESAELNAQAEIVRAKGTNEANHIMAQSLGGPENYLRWSYINMLQHTAGKGDRQVIYLPTEAGMPILEAGKR